MSAAESRREFLKQFHGLCRRWNAWDVWSDWLVMTSTAIYNSIHQDPTVETEYLAAAKRYDSDELATMANLIGITVQGLEAETHDFLGAVFHELELHNKQIGQFFTPFAVCRMMAALLRPEVPKPGRVLKVSEPAAGSGSMVLAMHLAMMDVGAAQWQILYQLKDLDHRAFRMSYIQTSLCGLAAEVVLGDTIRGTTDRVWRTPGYYLHDMRNRLRIDSMMRAIHGDDHDAPIPETIFADDPREPRSPGGDPTTHDVPSPVCDRDGRAIEIGGPPVDQSQKPKSPPREPPPPPMVPDLILPRPGEQFALF